MLVLGHRGDRQRFPDNTLEGIASAFERGADGVEIDVYYQSDRGIYLVHPYLHDRNKEYPNLEEVIKRFGKKGLLQVEVKFLETEGLKVIKDLVKKYKLKNIVLTSGVFPMLKYIRDTFPKEKINLLSSNLIEDWWTEEFGNYFLSSYAKLAGAGGIDTGYPGFWTKKRVEWFHKNGFRVSGHLSTDTKEEYQQLLKLGIDICTADKLDILKWK